MGNENGKCSLSRLPGRPIVDTRVHRLQRRIKFVRLTVETTIKMVYDSSSEEGTQLDLDDF